MHLLLLITSRSLRLDGIHLWGEFANHADDGCLANVALTVGILGAVFGMIIGAIVGASLLS